jgi:monoamine oxidase
MNKTLPEDKQARLNTRVTAISLRDDGKPGLSVTFKRNEAGSINETFGAVISTVPLSALNLIDMSGCKISRNFAQYSAIRELRYGPSIKIAIQFESNWWDKKGIVGGQRSVKSTLNLVSHTHLHA